MDAMVLHHNAILGPNGQGWKGGIGTGEGRGQRIAKEGEDDHEPQTRKALADPQGLHFGECHGDSMKN
jgi:hypothetical protein